ncbi:hypothetical protein PBAL39_09091 [Pedobacter sp. BAL39]|uniref:hypothetical protein n=1 Tax=Pedobacter sp. BAL39 TaxID=391596 RepID=UPI00015598DD|nr:hypothetical protein [Pedobacter sp. BAL39]EDM37286.1 hypothetical protein PBAL39_09091 [Pedobacter sp. BAL39]
MNSIFNFNRFALLVRRQWLDFGKIYLISLLVVTGAIIITYIFNLPKYTDDNHMPLGTVIRDGNFNMLFRIPLFLILGFAFISITASGYFSAMGQRPKAIIELMIPASTFEKWLCSVLYTGVLSVGSFYLIFYLTDLGFVSYIRHMLEGITFSTEGDEIHGLENRAVITRLFFAEFFEAGPVAYSLLIPQVITSLFLLGSIYFHRFHYIKTAVVSMIFLWVVGYTTIRFSQWMIGMKPMRASASFGSDPKLTAYLFLLVSTIVIAVFLSITTFFRLKEKEV